MFADNGTHSNQGDEIIVSPGIVCPCGFVPETWEVDTIFDMACAETYHTLFTFSYIVLYLVSRTPATFMPPVL